MSKFVSTRTVNPENPIVLSFDSNSNNLSLEIGLKEQFTDNPHFLLEIKNDVNSGTFVEIVENSINKNKSHENNTFAGEKVIIEQDESSSGVIFNDKIFIKRPELLDSNDGYITFDGDLENLSNGSIIFFLNNKPTSEEIIYSELGIYEKRDEDAHDITPFVLSFEDENPLLLDVDKDSLSFLLLGNEVKRDYSKTPTTIYKKKTITDTSYEYQSTKNSFSKSPYKLDSSDSYRIRIVISNYGRIISYSVFNKISKNWDTFKSLIFNVSKAQGSNYNVLFSVDDSEISNITANF